MHKKDGAGRGRVRAIVGAIVAGLCWTPAILAWWSDRPFVLDVVAHGLPHAVVLGIIVALPGLLLLRARRAALVAGLGLVLAAVGVYRHYEFPRDQPNVAGVPPTQPIRLISYNSRSAAPRADDPSIRWLLDQDADIIFLIESWTHFVTASPELLARYPHRIEPRSGMQWSILILSKHPMREAPLAPFSGEIQHSFMIRRAVVIDYPSGARLLVSAAHPPSPRSPGTWRRSIESVSMDGAAVRAWIDRNNGDIPAVIAGDFNSSPSGRVSRTFARRSGLLGWCAPLAGGTWPARLPPWLSIPIDRVWTTPDVVVTSLRPGPQFSSDHRPIVAELLVPVRPGGDGAKGAP